MIVKNLYMKNERSAFVHVFNSEVDFKHRDQIALYKVTDVPGFYTYTEIFLVFQLWFMHVSLFCIDVSVMAIVNLWNIDIYVEV